MELPIRAPFPDETDVLVIGSGAAGTAAAIEAGTAGLRTLVIESTHEIGGAASMSGAGCLFAGSALQRARGIEDSIDLALRDWAAWGGPEADLAWAARYLERAEQDIYRWVEGLGGEWTILRQMEGNSVPRWHGLCGGGPKLMAVLQESASSLPVTWATGARATEFVVNHGRVVSTLVMSAVGVHEVKAVTVILATGGVTGSAASFRRHMSGGLEDVRVLSGGAPGATGSGHRMLETLGAQFVGLDRIWTYAYATVDVRDALGTRGLAVRGLSNTIWLNRRGRRFHDESKDSGSTATPALLDQESQTCWAVFDHDEAQLVTLSNPAFGTDDAPDRVAVTRFLEASPYVHQAGSLRELAERADLSADSVVRSVESYNGWIERGRSVDPEFGRSLDALRTISTPPFYAIQFFPMARKSLGGVCTDGLCRVRRADGDVVGNLFAAGEVAGMAGGHINGRAALEGTMLGPSLFSGRVAGRRASDYVIGREDRDR